LRHRAAELGDQATFLQTRTYREALDEVEEPVSVCQPTSWAADRLVRLTRSTPEIKVLPARGFCTDRETFDKWAHGHQTLKLENFYHDARRRFDLLMDGNRPAEGRWNFDADNREPAPAQADDLGVAPPWRPDEDEIDEQVCPRAEMVRRVGRRRCRRALPERCARAGARSWLGAPHSEADGVVQLCATAWLEPLRGHGLVPPLLRRRLRMGDGRQRGRHVPARRRRIDGNQAVHLRRCLHQSDERLLRPMPVSTDRNGSATTHAHSPAGTGGFWTAAPNSLRTTTE
jgi:Deoxyribodipyrimidine photo-lyase-related protein